MSGNESKNFSSGNFFSGIVALDTRNALFASFQKRLTRSPKMSRPMSDDGGKLFFQKKIFPQNIFLDTQKEALTKPAKICLTEKRSFFKSIYQKKWFLSEIILLWKWFSEYVKGNFHNRAKKFPPKSRYIFAKCPESIKK